MRQNVPFWWPFLGWDDQDKRKPFGMPINCPGDTPILTTHKHRNTSAFVGLPSWVPIVFGGFFKGTQRTHRFLWSQKRHAQRQLCKSASRGAPRKVSEQKSLGLVLFQGAVPLQLRRVRIPRLVEVLGRAGKMCHKMCIYIYITMYMCMCMYSQNKVCIYIYIMYL